MTNEEEKPDMKRYDYLGLVAQLNEADQIYTLAAMDNYVDGLQEKDLRENSKAQLRSSKQGSGLEHAIEASSEKYVTNRNKTTLKDFCDIYSVDEFTRKSLESYSKRTIGDIEKEYSSLTEIVKSKTGNFTKEQKEDAKKKLEEYNPVMAKIKFVEDERFTNLKIDAIKRTKQNMEEEEKEKQLANAA